MSISKQQEEVDNNYHSLMEMIKQDALPVQDFGKFAPMKDKKIVGVFTTWGDADQSGRLKYDTDTFSVQEIIDQPKDLGFFSYAVV